MKHTNNIEIMTKNGYRRIVDVDAIAAISESSKGAVITLIGGAIIFTSSNYTALKELVLERALATEIDSHRLTLPETECEHAPEDYDVPVDDSDMFKFSLIGESKTIENIAHIYQLDIQGSDVLNEYHSILQFEAREDDVIGISPMFLMRGWR